MKKLVATLLTLSMITGFAFAEIDIHSLSDRDLLVLRSSIADEIASRGLDNQDLFDADDRKEAFRKAMLCFDFDGLNEMVDSFIASYVPDANSKACMMRAILDEVEVYRDILVVETDAFDGTTMVHFKDCETISESVSVAPYMSYGWTGTQFGFIKKGWLFFDRFDVAVDGNIVYSEYETYAYDSFDRQEKVLEAGLIQEWVDMCSVDDESIYDAVSSGNTAVIRFSNTSKKEHYDHTFTEAEKRAWAASYRLTELMNQMYALCNQS